MKVLVITALVLLLQPLFFNEKEYVAGTLVHQTCSVDLQHLHETLEALKVLNETIHNIPHKRRSRHVPWTISLAASIAGRLSKILEAIGFTWFSNTDIHQRLQHLEFKNSSSTMFARKRPW